MENISNVANNTQVLEQQLHEVREAISQRMKSGHQSRSVSGGGASRNYQYLDLTALQAREQYLTLELRKTRRRTSVRVGFGSVTTQRVSPMSWSKSSPVTAGVSQTEMQEYVQQALTDAQLGGDASAQNVEFTPEGDIEAQTVQEAIAEVDAEKLSSDYALPIDPVLQFDNALI